MADIRKSAIASLEKIVLDPQYHDILTLVKGVRNGIVYGAKIRFPHALVMIFLFRHGSLHKKASLVFNATRQHARNLGLFALVYKSLMLLLRQQRSGSMTGLSGPEGAAKESRYDTFLAGLVGGYLVFGRTIDSAVSQQIVIYVFARVALACAKLVFQPRLAARGAGAASASPSPGASPARGAKGIVGGFGVLDARPEVRDRVINHAWTVFASLSWASVMYLFRWHPDAVQPSLRSSMNYIYEASDHWDSLRNFIVHNK